MFPDIDTTTIMQHASASKTRNDSLLLGAPPFYGRALENEPLNERFAHDRIVFDEANRMTFKRHDAILWLR